MQGLDMKYLVLWCDLDLIGMKFTNLLMNSTEIKA